MNNLEKRYYVTEKLTALQLVSSGFCRYRLLFELDWLALRAKRPCSIQGWHPATNRVNNTNNDSITK